MMIHSAHFWLKTDLTAEQRETATFYELDVERVKFSLGMYFQTRLKKVGNERTSAAAFARDAFRRYGKGVGAPGVLNYGDCLVYGVARATGHPLLFKGNDFSQTDVVAAQ